MKRQLLCFVLATSCATLPKVTPTESPIVQAGNPVLRARAAEVPTSDIGTPTFAALVERMVQAMRAAPGVGLAAPQLGIGLRVLVMEDTEERMAALSAAEREERQRVPVALRVIVNPVLKLIGERKATFFEGCLSVSGFAALVPRAQEVEVSGLDEKGVPIQWRVRGWPARILQHEVDHLDGTLYLDRMLSRSFGTLPQVKARFAGKRQAEVFEALGLTAP
jgi:peptide deformylase